MSTQCFKKPGFRLLSAAALLALALPACAQPAPVVIPAGAADPASRAWLAQQFMAYDNRSTSPPVGAPSSIAQSLATWDLLRRPPPSPSLAPPLGLQGQFIANHPGWPGLSAIRRRAEAQAADPLTPDSEARAFLAAVPPQSAAGQARLALVSSGSGAIDLARAAWTRAGIDQPTEDMLLIRFGPSITADDHARRADALLWAGQTSAAQRLLPRLAPDARALTEARLAYRTGAADADARAALVPPALRSHPGLANDRATWFERRGQLSSAEATLANGSTTPGAVVAPESWLERRLAMGRAAMRRGDHSTAYAILANHRTVASGADPKALPLSVRVDLSDTEWLAGWIALRRLNRPDDAARHFQLFLDSVTTPISQSRGVYWLGRAEEARGRKPQAQAAYEAAARHSDYFYGQLAAEALGRTPALLAAAPAQPSPADSARFEASSLRKAVETLAAMGSRERESLFVRALGESMTTPGEARLAGQLGQRLTRPDLGVWTWKTVRPLGDTSLFDLAYPRLPAGAPIPPREWFISHAIARQESSFDRTAASSTGARGLMQLMPATAQDVAAKLGLPYDSSRLYSDPAYNLTMGSYYVGLRRDNFSNAMMAIAAYNAGAGNVRKWIAMNGDPRGGTTADLIDWVEMIPFSETRTYVHRVTENAVVYSLLEPNRTGARPRASDWLRGS